MPTDIKVPVFPESVTDGVVATWHKRPGDAVRRDETLVEIETDKVMFEVPAPGDGTLSEVLQEEGATVAAGEVLGRIEAGAGEGGEAGRRDGAGQARPPGPAAGGEARPGPGPEAGSDASPGADAGPDASPAARRLLSEHDLSAREVEGSGRDGRILKEDVLRAIDDADSSRAVAARRPAPAAGAAEAAPARMEPQGRGAPAGRASPPAAASTVVEFPAEDRPQRRVRMTRLRARVAERLVQAQQTAAMLTTFNEVDMQPVMELRTRYRDAFEKAHGVRLGFMSFFVLAAVEALKRFPMVNASIEGDDIVSRGFYDVGIAVASPRGLVVPVLRDADRLGVAAIEQRIADLAAKARDGALSIDEITGGTFTITNGGVFGSLLSTPILNPPQSAILGMHRIEQRPVVVDGEIVARPMMYLALSYDHRLVDGREAVLFLATIRDLLQDPARLLLEV